MNKDSTAKITSYTYKNSTKNYTLQRVKNNRRPKGAISGGNGSFRMAGSPPEVIVTVDVSNHPSQEINVYNMIKSCSSRSRLSKKYCEDICRDFTGNELQIQENRQSSDYVLSQLSKMVKQSTEKIDEELDNKKKK